MESIEEKVWQVLQRDLKLARQLYMSEEKGVRKQEIFGQIKR
ncbi:hypothetical protein [Wolbachia endosymbiont of Madathamugadia hiepei]|nr:hypothetical protein [Wolbachia endosymbiont of Madathamugadia hiepei]